jgi:TetR/AcrR family transcriptional regulator, cholesterol catabolism regulator
MSSSQRRTRGKRRGQPGAKRDDILAAAIERFGRSGYEHTKWADIAADVAVGPTALYHYFESKQHCLFVIMDTALEDERARFEALTADNPDHIGVLLALLQDRFDLTEHEILRNRLLVAEQALLAHRCDSPREEAVRRQARAHTSELELAWAGILERAMEAGAIADAPPRLTARAILGLYNSVWLWYRPNGTVELNRMAGFFTDRILAMLGVEPERVRRLRLAA